MFKANYNADNSLDKLKARLVAKGFNQEAGMDYSETFSPVAKPATVRLLFTLATVKDWQVYQLDIKNAFLNGVLTETIHVDQPPGFKHKHHPDHVCKLHKALYGLKQALRVWLEMFSSLYIKNSLPLLLIHHSSLKTLMGTC